MSRTSNSNSTVAIDPSNCPLATIIWNSVGRPSFKIKLGASNRILPKSIFGMAWTKHPYLWARQCLTPRNPLETIAFSAYFLLSSYLILEETLWVRLVLSGVVVKFGRQQLDLAFLGFVVSAESLIMMMCQVIVVLLSTDLSCIS